MGEHGEDAHGFFLYDATLHVPLIIKFPGSRWKGRVVGDQVRGIDVAPTILATLGVPAPATMQGRILTHLAAGEQDGPAPPAFSETYYPYYHFGWSPLISIRTATHKFIRAPRPEFYELSPDPGETKNLAKAGAPAAASMRARLDREYPQDAKASTPEPAGTAKLKALKSLGYLGSQSPARTLPYGQLPDPKDKIRVYTLLEHALQEGERGNLPESNALLRQALKEDDRIVDAHLNLGVNLAQSGDMKAAMEAFRRALSLGPRNVIAAYNLALASARLGDLDQAIAGFSRTLELDPRHTQARLDLGRAYQLQGKIDSAVEAFRKAIVNDPNSAEAHYYLSRVYDEKGLQAEAESERRTAERLGFRDPSR